MPRKKTVSLQRRLNPDRKYQSVLVQRLINKSMLNGKKLIAERAVYEALETAAKKLDNENPLEVFERALKNVSPNFEVKSRRVGGATFQVPTEIRADRKDSISMKNLILYSRKRSGRSMAEKLAAEIVDAYNSQGGAYKRKEEIHRMAEANRAFAHFRF